MDAALRREREAFKKRALSTPVVENRKKDVSSDHMPKKKPKPSSGSTSSSGNRAKSDGLNYKSMTGSSQYNFGILTKIVRHMKQRHLDGTTDPLSLEDILDETNQLDIGSRQRHWLDNEALQNNPKLQLTPDGRYQFKPAYNLRDRKSLNRLLDRYDQRGQGGILLDDIMESLPNAEKNIKLMGDNIIFIIRPMDKKKVCFYNDKSMQFSVDEEFQKLWRGVAVDGIDDQKIEEYLQKQGITSMQDMGLKKGPTMQKRKKGASKKSRTFKKHNDHMGDILKEYTDD